MVITQPTHSQEILKQRRCKVQLRNKTNVRLQQAKHHFLESLTAAVTVDNPSAILKIEELQNAAEEAELEIQGPIQIKLTEDKSSNNNADQRSYR